MASFAIARSQSEDTRGPVRVADDAWSATDRMARSRPLDRSAVVVTKQLQLSSRGTTLGQGSDRVAVRTSPEPRRVSFEHLAGCHVDR